MDKQREGFEKAYEPNPNKSPFTEVKFDEVARVYKPLDQFNPRIASSLNAAWYGWRIRQAEVDGLQAKVGELENDTSLMLASHKRMSIGLLQQQDKIEKLTKERDELQRQLSEYIFVAETLDEMYVKEVKSSEELQKRVDALEKAEFTLARIRSIVRKNLLESILIKEVRQALKGEGQ